MKKNRLLLLLLIFLFFLPIKTKASNICTSTKFSNLKREAYKTQITYELKFDNKHNPYFEVTAYNVSNDIMIVFDGSEFVPDSNNQIKFVNYFEGGKKYEFRFYGGRNNSCVEEYVYTKKIELPNYNMYSEREECIEYEEFPLCNKWYKGEIKDENDFLDKLEEYKKTLVKEVEEVKKEETKSLFDQIIEFYTNNLILCVTITVFIVLAIIVIIIRLIVKRRKKIKLDF